MNTKKPPRDLVSVRLDPDVRATVKRVAELERRPVSNLVRNILVDWARAHGGQQGEAA